MPLTQLDLSLGALEIGVLLSSTLWGVTTVQLYVYITAQNKDPWWTRALVWLVWILESCHTIFAWYYIYRLTVTFYGQPAALTESNWSFDMSALFDGIIGAIAQMFFAYRVRLLSKSWIITLVSWTGSILQLACTCAITALSPTLSVAEFGIKFGWIIEAALIINLIVDVINTAALSYYLNRGRTGWKGSDIIVEKLVMWTIETGLLTAVAALLQVVLFKAEPTTALWIGISLFYAKLYSNSFLAILNSRSILRRNNGTSGGAQTSSMGRTTMQRTWNPQLQTNGVTVTVVQDVELGHVNPKGPGEMKSTLDL